MTNQTPTILTDAGGRKIEIRTLTVLDQLRLLKAAGPENSNNERYMQLVQVAASVKYIDGVPMPPIATEKQIEGVVQKLGDEGYAAIIVHMRAEIAAAEAAALDAAGGDAAEDGKEAANPLRA